MSFRAEKRVPASQLLRQAAAVGLAVVLTAGPLAPPPAAWGGGRAPLGAGGGVAVVLTAGTLAPPAAAWEGRTHRLVTVRAIEALPYPLRDFFEENRPAITPLRAQPAHWGGEG